MLSFASFTSSQIWKSMASVRSLVSKKLMSWSSWSIPNPQSAPMILRSLASSGQKFLSLDKLKLTSLNSWKLPERLLPSCRRSAMVHASICLNPHFPATRSPRSRYIVTTSRPSCRARTKQNRLRAKRHAQPMAPTGLQRPRQRRAAPGSAGRRFQRFQYQLVSARRMEKRWVSRSVKSCFNGASTLVYNVLSSAWCCKSL